VNNNQRHTGECSSNSSSSSSSGGGGGGGSGSGSGSGSNGHDGGSRLAESEQTVPLPAAQCPKPLGGATFGT
jgi:hypothetical protein